VALRAAVELGAAADLMGCKRYATNGNARVSACKTLVGQNGPPGWGRTFFCL